MPTDLQYLLERLGGAAAAEADGVGRFFLVIPVRGDDGARGVGAIDDDVGGRRRGATYGVIDNDRQNSAAPT
jgi:hypothetical protein